MASPIPTQLSPGVNVSEIDLSQFVQPESLNSGGMVGIFNWGPGYEKNRVSTESQLAELYGKPTLDQSDVVGNTDFLSAANFLKYSNNLNVIRVLKSTDSNSTSDEAGITNINSCQYRSISSFEEFKKLGGFSSDSQGIEPLAHFRARYPGNFGDSLKVYVSDGNTTGTTPTGTQINYSGSYNDFTLKGGYQGSMIQGVTSGICGLTLQSFVEEIINDGQGNLSRTVIGSTGGNTGGITFINIPYYIVTFEPPEDVTPTNFIGLSDSPHLASNFYERFNFLYASGTTTANYNLTGNGINPDGNVQNTFPLGYHGGIDNVNQAKPITPFTPYDFGGNLGTVGWSPKVLMRINPSNAAFVDMIFMNFDKQSIGVNDRYNAPQEWQAPNNGNPEQPNFDGNGRKIIFTDVIASSGVPSHFATTQESTPRIFFSQYTTTTGINSLFTGDIVTEIQTDAKKYNARNTPIQRSFDFAHLVYPFITGDNTYPPPTTVKGLATLIGLTGTHNVRTYSTLFDSDSVVEKTVDFGNVGGVTGIRDNFKYGIIQIGEKADVTGTIQTSNGESSGGGSESNFVFEKQPGTSPYAASLGGSNDEINIVIVDAGGKFGAKNSVLERFELLSKAVDGKNADNQSIYYKDFINNNSKYVYMTRAFDLVGGNANYASKADSTFGEITYQYIGADGVTYTKNSNYETTLNYGESGVSAATISEYSKAYAMFADDDNAVDVLFIPELYMHIADNSSETTLESYVYDNIISKRKDTILVLPTENPGSANQNSAITTNNAIQFRKTKLTIPSNSYTVLVAGRKIFFDTFNNQLRKMPLSSDVAGILCAQEIPWESPAGFSRGFIRNAVKLETNFSKADRDELYKNGINFFVQFNDGSGTVLFSDKTMLTKPSAFDRINVRRVFIALEKAIAKAAKYSLFEFNDEFTRSQFRNLVTPFLSSVQAQRGIADFKVVCDETNNTSQVIDSNQFVADIYIKPLKSINFVQLNFVAVRSDFNLTTIE